MPSTLAAALDELREGHAEAALELLVGAWADDPHPRLAALILQLSAEARSPASANVRGKTAAARAAWDERAASARTADRPMLLESLCDVNSGDGAKRLPIVEGWMPDPRVDAALVDVLRDVPYRATSTKPFWTRLFALLQQIKDPAQVARIAAIDFAGVAKTMADWLHGKRQKLLAALASLESDHEPRAIFDELAAVIGGQREAGVADRADIEQLLRSVYEAPDDDGPRVVLADALIERNDPRGELISVQLRLAQDPTDRALKTRERELLAAHAKGWLGELAPILMADVRFERGFLAACKVDNSQLDRVRKLVGHPAWSTVRAIEGSALIALDPVMRSLEKLVFEQSNARSHEGLPDAWRDLLVETPRQLVELQYESMHKERQWLDTVEGRREVDVSDQSEIDALCACATLPKLRRLGLRDNPILYIGKLVHAPVLDRLEQLSFIYERNNRFVVERRSPLVDFKQLLEMARVPTLRFEVGSFHETELILERGTQGYERARMTIGPTMKSSWSASLVDEAIKMLDALPAALRELRVTTRKWTETQQVARLRAAATQMNLECEVSERA
ncbi:MAG: TIGR02996 domain-containing protein [Myxococcota bacterium]|nr:TIGR02996 domain-containing protein [Myxococcota bacterium]